MSKVKIILRPNGPFRIEDPEGQVEVVDVNGAPYTPANPALFALCRCGQSGKQPFCDGTHKSCGYQSSDAAPTPAQP